MKLYERIADSFSRARRCTVLPVESLGEDYFCDKAIFLDRNNHVGVLKNFAGQLQITYIRYSDFKSLKTLVRSTKKVAINDGCSEIFFDGDNQDISQDLKTSLKTLGFKEYVSPYSRGQLSFLKMEITVDLNRSFIW